MANAPITRFDTAIASLCRWKLIRTKAMDPVMITCEVSSQPAFVLKACYKYEADGPDGRPAMDHVLSAARIPDCRRTELLKCRGTDPPYNIDAGRIDTVLGLTS